MKPLKNITILVLFLVTGLLASGQVMISQYIEGITGTNHKGIEVYNYTAYPIDFSVTPLEVSQGINGAACTNLPGATVNTGILLPFQVWVIGTSDLTAAALTGNDIAGVTTHGFNFNGNDALEIYLGGVLMDVIGTCGNDPGTSWSGNGVSTADQNIAVKSGVCTGTTDNWTDPSIRFEKISDGSIMTGFGDAPLCRSNTITISTISSLSYTVDCNTTASGSIDFTSTGIFTTGNTFTAELSDETGSYSNYTSIGTLPLIGTAPSGTINFTIPANTTSGTTYRIRVVSDSPTSYVTDNGSDISITNSAPCAITECMNESFDNIPSGSPGNYIDRAWTGDNGDSFTATDAKTDQSIIGKAITIRNGLLTVNSVTGGIGALTLTTQIGVGSGSGNLSIYANTVLVGMAPYDGTVQTTTINGINIMGPIDLKIDFGSNGDRIKIDDLTWTCYSSSHAITIASVSSLSYNVDCDASENGSIDFTTSGVYTSGNTFTAELSDETGSFISFTEVGTLSLNGTNPTGTINYTIPANTTTGSAYRIRVVSDTPSSNTSDNGNDISINNTAPCIPIVPLEGALLINEFSNGPAGNQEYYELLVLGDCGDSVDIRGFILDDNNGDFGIEGISPGHLKFKDHSQWEKVAVGSIIVIYYSTDKNPKILQDDINATNNNYVYIIPHDNNSLIEIYSDYPNKTNFTYSQASATSIAWTTTLGLNNINDAAQTRFPNGDFFFGVSYGSAMTGGSENMKLTNNSLSGKNAYFNSGDFRNINNWSVGNAPANETPGAPNNPANKAWIEMLRNPNSALCALIPLPVSIVNFEGEYNNGEVELSWKSHTEQNNDYYEVFHSQTGYDFTSIGRVDGAGNSSSLIDYSLIHRESSSGIHYYRLKSVDYDGTEHINGTISVQVNRDEIIYDRHTQSLHFPQKGQYTMYSISGQKILDVNNESQVQFSRQGVYLIYNQKSGVVTKIAIP